MSAGEIAGLVAAGALVLLVALVAVPLLKLGRTLDETTLTIRQVREQSAPILTQASTTVTHVNSNLERVDDITGNAASYVDRLPTARRVRPVVRTKLPPAGLVPGDDMS